MKRVYSILLFFLMIMGGVSAAPLDELESLLREKPQVQEKIYVHTDNNSYFLGDTLWYKAYVVRADDLKPTNYSKLLYVELVSPDGYVVERQHVIVKEDGSTHGQFVLTDSLYSGYYEIRAYTRWQLNFNVTHRDYTRDDELKFYGRQSANDFFREWEGLYSRVVPVYQKPTEKGDFSERYMARRPKQQILKERKAIYVNFYPEGGHLVEGVANNVAFEIRDNNGELLNLSGKLSDGTAIKAQHLGKGSFRITPTASKVGATFQWEGKTWNFNLPEAEKAGLALSKTSATTITLNAMGVTPAAYAILCRGKLVTFNRINGKEIKLEGQTGINELIVYDAEAKPLASRLFFVNNNDFGTQLTPALLLGDGATVDNTTTVDPFAPMTLKVDVPNMNANLCVSVMDNQTADAGYNDGNILTDMLLSSELRGFIPNPAQYFKPGAEQDLDLLMQVQGWRKYKRVSKLRYLPERTLTFEGTVMTIPEVASLMELTDLQNVGEKAVTISDVMQKESERANGGIGIETETAEQTGIEDNFDGLTDNYSLDGDIEYATQDDSRLGSGRVRRSVLVEAEIVKDGESAGAIARTDKNGHFIINLPPYYDNAILFVKAYTPADSASKCMEKKDKNFLNARAFPDYFVKRDMIFPIFSQPYSWYQINSPELEFVDEEDLGGLPPTNSSLAGDHRLQTVIVKAKRRGKRRLDMTKPAYVRDIYSLYNDVSDYGLMLGVFDMKRFPLAAATYLCGNMGRRNQFNIRAILNGTSFYRNYTPTVQEYDKPATPYYMYDNLQLERLKDLRMFTDYELRTDSGTVVDTYNADVTLDFEPLEEGSKRYVYRDRRYVLDGIAYAEEFYSPDYSGMVPKQRKQGGAEVDYRRTLYWNPNLKPDENGKYSVTLYNNARPTRVRVVLSGLDADGHVYY